MMKIAAIVHVFYPDLWPELFLCLGNALRSVPCDVFVTYSDDAAVRQARLDCPNASFIPCENVGFDLWPFLKVLGHVDLSSYTHVLKLHTKRDVPAEPRIVFNGMDCTGARWRDELLSFVRTPEAWRATLAKIAEPDVAAVAGVRCILRRDDVPMEPTRMSFDRGLELARSVGLRPIRPQFVGGTMFLMRAEMLAPLRGRWHAEDFAVPDGHESGTLSHDIERLVGFCACVNGWKIADPGGELRSYRRRVAVQSAMDMIARFFWQTKCTRGGGRIVKLLRVPVWRTSRRKDVEA
jgi:lipopolysaccharide biosynthesis protein